MKYSKIIGKIISARSVEEKDSEFVLRLRLDQRLNFFIHSTSPDLASQREWIRNQQTRIGDYYFLLSDLMVKPFGLASIYNICGTECEFGRWISEGNAFQNLETVILMHDFGFNTLGLERINTFTRKENSKVVRFWIRFGAVTDEDIFTNNILYHHSWLDKDSYLNVIRPTQIKLIDSRR